MTTNQPPDRVEITLRTDAILALPEKAKYESEIRAILNREGIEVTDLAFREGSTIITVLVLVGAGVGFCFSQFFAGAFKAFGERGAKFLLSKWEGAGTDDNQAMTTTLTPIKSITYPEPSGTDILATEESLQILSLMRSAESACHALTALAYELPGIEKSITVVAASYNRETQELIEEIYQRKVSRR